MRSLLPPRQQLVRSTLLHSQFGPILRIHVAKKPATKLPARLGGQLLRMDRFVCLLLCRVSSASSLRLYCLLTVSSLRSDAGITGQRGAPITLPSSEPGAGLNCLFLCHAFLAVVPFHRPEPLAHRRTLLDTCSQSSTASEAQQGGNCGYSPKYEADEGS